MDEEQVNSGDPPQGRPPDDTEALDTKSKRSGSQSSQAEGSHDDPEAESRQRVRETDDLYGDEDYGDEPMDGSQVDSYGEEERPEEEEEEEEPLIQPMTFDIAGYGDELDGTEIAPADQDAKLSTDKRVKKEIEEDQQIDDLDDGGDDIDDKQSSIEDGGEPGASEGSNIDDTHGDDAESGEQVHSMDKDQFANETFRGPMLIDDDKDDSAKVKQSLSLGGSSAASGDKAKRQNLKVEETTTQTPVPSKAPVLNSHDSIHQIAGNEDYQSPDRHNQKRTTGQFHQDVPEPKMLSTASFKIVQQSSIAQIKNADYTSDTIGNSSAKAPKGFTLPQNSVKKPPPTIKALSGEIEVTDQSASKDALEDPILTLGNDAYSDKNSQEKGGLPKVRESLASQSTIQKAEVTDSTHLTSDEAKRVSLMRSTGQDTQKLSSKEGDKDSMAQAGETFSDNLGGRVRAGLNVNLISYQTAAFGNVNQSVNTIKSAAFGGATQNETGVSHAARQTMGEGLAKPESRLSQNDNEGHVLGMGITVGANMSSQVVKEPGSDKKDDNGPQSTNGDQKEDSTHHQEQQQTPDQEKTQDMAKSPAKSADQEADLLIASDNSKEKLTINTAPSQSTSTLILTTEQKLIMTEQTSNWQLRTTTIDEIHIQIQKTVEDEPELVLKEAENMLEFFVGLLSDQNFKIVLMTLSIVNLIIGMPQHLQNAGSSPTSKLGRASPGGSAYLSSSCLGKHIPRFIGKLADSKNIIRQQAIRALIGIFMIMRFQTISQSQTKVKETLLQSPMTPNSLKHGGPKLTASVNNFIQMVLPYLVNSNSWHVREELLHVLIICFLKSSQSHEQVNAEFDAHQILEMLLKMLDDQKQRIRFTAVEAIVAFVNTGNAQRAQQIIYQFGDRSMGDLIMERLKAPAQMNPHLNENGALEMPYLEHVEEANQFQMEQAQQQMNSTNGRREGLNSGPPGQLKNLTQNPMNTTNRGNSSGRKFGGAPPSANSLTHGGGQAKRTASANNPKYANEPQGQMSSALGQSANQKKYQSPMYNAFESGFSQQHQTTNALSDFGSAISTSNGNMYGSSKRQQISRHSNDRSGSNTTSFLPQLNNQNSQMGPGHETPQQQHLYQQNSHLGASAGPHSSHLQGMIMRGPPSSENRFYQNVNGEPGNSFYNQGHNYQRKVSASSHNQIPMALKSRGSGAPSPNQMMMQNSNLSNHPINLLKNDLQAPIASNQTDPMVSPQQPSFNELMSRKYKNLMSVEYDSLSEMGGAGAGGNQMQSYLNQPMGVGPGGNFANGPPGYMHQHHQLMLQQPFSTENKQGEGPQRKSRNGQRSQGNNFVGGEQDQTGSSYYSHSRGGWQSYSAVSTNEQNSGQHPSSQKHSAGGIGISGNQELMFHQQQAQYQQQMLFSGGSMGEGPLQAIPPGANNQMIGIGIGRSPQMAAQGSFQNGRGLMGPNGQQPNAQQMPGGKYIKSTGNTFYTDSNSNSTNTTATTNTQVANQMKQKQLRQQQLARSKLAMGSGTTPQVADENIADSMGIFGISGRGPVKARQLEALKKEDSVNSLKKAEAQGSNQPTPQGQNESSMQELVIDSRRPKRPMGSTSYDIDQLGQEAFDQQMGSSPTNVKPPLSRNKQVLEKARRSNMTVFSNDNQPNSDLLVDGDGFATASFKLGEGEEGSGHKVNERSKTATTGGSSILHNKVTYLSSDELEPLSGKQIDKTFQQALLDLVSSPDWNIQFQACNIVRRVCKFHQNLVLQSGATLHSLVKTLCKLADSLRSSLSKIALITIRDMFDNLKRCMETYMDPLIKILLKRVCDTSSFISEEAYGALMSLTVNCSDRKVLTILLTQSGKATNSRVHICNCLQQLVHVLGNNILFFKDSDKLVNQLAAYMKDASQEVRASAKKSFMLMSNAVMGHNDLEKLLQRVLNEVDYKKVKSFLDNEAQNFQGTGDLPTGQEHFVISNGLPLMGSEKDAFAPSSQQLQTGVTPSSQIVIKQMRSQGGKGTLRTGSHLSNKLRESQNSVTHLRESASGALTIGQSHSAVVGGATSQLAANNASGHDLNIKATSIKVDPSKIVRGGNRQNLKTSGSQSSAKNGLPSKESASSLRNQFH